MRGILSLVFKNVGDGVPFTCLFNNVEDRVPFVMYFNDVKN